MVTKFMKKNEKIAIVVPVYNEEEVITKFINECYNSLNSYISTTLYIINDGSNDLTTLKIKSNNLFLESREDFKIKIINLSRNFGHQNAVKAGLNNINNEDLICVIDSDLQDPPALIRELIEEQQISGSDIIYTKRISRKGESKFKIITAKLFYYFFNKISDVKISSNSGDFFLITKKACLIFNKFKEKELFIRAILPYIGLNSSIVYYKRNPRFAGNTKYPFSKMIDLSKNAIFSFSEFPIKRFFQMGFFFLFLSFSLIIYLLILKFFYGGVTPGILLLTIVITFFSSLNFLSLWVLGEYIGRIFKESKNRPSYIIKDIISN